MRNAYYIDETKKNRTLTVLDRIHGIRLHAKYIEETLNEEIKETAKLIDNMKRKKDDI